MAKPDLCDRSLSLLFLGLHLLCQVSILCEEAQHLGTEGLQKVEMAVAGSEAESLYSLLRKLYHIPHVLCPTPSKRHHQAPTTTVSRLPPQEPREVKPEPSTPAAEGDIMAQEVPSLAISQALEVAIPAHMTPLCLNKGCQMGLQMPG